MKKISCFLISISIVYQIYADEVFLYKINSFVEDIYTAKTIDISNLFSLVYDKQLEYLNTINNKEDVLYELLFGATSLSYYITYDNSEKSKALLFDIEKNISYNIRKTKNEKVLNQYVKYLYSKIAWAKNSFAIIESLPIWYEKNLVFNQSSEILLWYSVWYINAVTEKETNWIAFIKDSEKLIEELSLLKIDLFNIYLAYAIFYVKIHETQKGLKYLEMADKLFPDSFPVAILENNFKNGRYGW